MTVDAVYYNANVLTCDQDNRRATAFAVSGERITAIGTDQDITALAEPGTHLVDLHGNTVVPGFIDAHPHTVHRAMDTLHRPSIAGAQSITEIVNRVAEHAAHREPGDWIVTSPLGEPPDYSEMPDKLAENRWPTRHDLDLAAPHNPVLIPATAFWPNPAVLNSGALTELGITATTPDEPGAQLLRDTNGEPTGVVRGLSIYQMGSTLMRRLLPHLPVPAGEPLQEAIGTACEQNIAAGVTTCYEAHGTFSTTDLRALADTGQLPHRVVCAYEIPARAPMPAIEEWFTQHADAAGAGTRHGLLHVRGATVSLDGPPHFGLSYMNTPYRGPDDVVGNGTPNLDTGKLVDIARAAVRHDMRLNVMAAGSAACSMTVHALRTVHTQTPLTGRNWVLQHFFYPAHEDMADLAAMGISVQTVTSVDHSRGEEVYVHRMNDDSWQQLSPLRWWIDAGIPVAVGSDGAHYNPLFQLWCALTRIDGRTGRDLRTPAKTIDRDEALATLTRNAATVLQAHDSIGSLTPGKFADFVVLDRDIRTCPIDSIPQTATLATALGGVARHDPHHLLVPQQHDRNNSPQPAVP